MCESISSKVAVSKLGKVASFKILLYSVQSVLLNCSRGLMGIWIGSDEIRAIIGKWSEGVRGPGRKWVL